MIILADDREKSSGIIDLLKEADIDVIVRRLPCYDYIINKEIGVERKTGRDFLISIMDGRLFRQARIMKNRLPRPLFLLEGNPFRVDIDFTSESIRGAILSLQAIWYIPVLFSKSKEETCQILRFIGQQDYRNASLIKLRHGYRPKKLITRQLYMLQGFPKIGPLMANRMLEHFGSVRNVMTADREALMEIEGIGKSMADTICNILEKPNNRSHSGEKWPI